MRSILSAAFAAFLVVSVSTANAQLYRFSATSAAGNSTGGGFGEAVSGTMNFAKSGNTGVLDIYMSITPAPGASQAAILYGFGFNYDDTKWDVTGYNASLFSGTLSSGVSLTTTSFPLVEPFNANGLGGTLHFDVGAGQTTPSNSGWKGGALTSGAVGHFQFTFNALTPGAGFTPDLLFQTGSGPGGTSDFMFEIKQTGAGQSDRFAVDLIISLEPVPEPSTYGIFGAAVLVGVAGIVRRRRAKITG